MDLWTFLKVQQGMMSVSTLHQLVHASVLWELDRQFRHNVHCFILFFLSLDESALKLSH